MWWRRWRSTLRSAVGTQNGRARPFGSSWGLVPRGSISSRQSAIGAGPNISVSSGPTQSMGTL
eukprot:7822966-Alexandrium_andersonii.AAC.1